jgi:hypothetical protein
VCPLHRDPSFFQRLAGVFGKDSETPPVAADQAGLPAPPAISTSGALPPAARPGDVPRNEDKDEKVEQGRKRGFWAKVFGRGKDDKKKPDEPKKKPGGN